MKNTHQHTKQQVAALNQWRSGYNPLRGLDTTRVVQLLEEGERGIYANLQWLYRTMEMTDATLIGLKSLRLACLLNLDRSITVTPDEKLPPGATPQMAQRQAVTLREAYDRIDNLKAAIRHLALATFRGYSHLEKHFAEDWTITHLEPVDHWFFSRDGLYGDWLYNPEAMGVIRGDELAEGSWIVREVDSPINRVGLISFMRKNLSQKDWDGFIEVFGIPSIFMVAPQGLTKEQYEQWSEVAENIAGDGRGAIPSGGDVKTVGGDVRGNAPFLEHIKYQDSCTVLAGTGGKLAMLTESGSGTLAGSAHMQVFEEIAEGEANEISELLQGCIDRPVLERRHPGEPVLARFALEAEDSEDVGGFVENVRTLGEGGYDVDADEISERTGLTVTRREEVRGQESGVRGRVANKAPMTHDPMTNDSRAAGRAAEEVHGNLLAAARLRMAEEQQAALLPVAEALGSLILAADRDGVSEEMYRNLLQDFLTVRLPALLTEINAAPGTEDVLYETLSAALVNGAAEARASRGEIGDGRSEIEEEEVPV